MYAPGPERLLIEAVLVVTGHQAVLVGDAVGFAEAFGSGDYALALVAVTLPWGDGIEVLGALRRRHPTVPVVLLGDPSVPGAVRAAIQAGASDILPPSVHGLAALYASLGSVASPHAVGAPDSSHLAARCAALEAENAALRAAPPVDADAARQAAELAHDLHEPLRSIRLLAERVEEASATGDDVQARARLADVYDAVGRMESLVDATLAAVRTQSEAVTDAGVSASRELPGAAPEASLAIEPLFDEVRGDLTALLQETGGSVTRDRLPVVHAAPHLVRQILQNLITNGLRYGGQPPAVRVSAAWIDERWVISVSDNGFGIPVEDRDTIFRPLTRLQPGGLQAGHGLGLAICRKLVARVGGTLWVEDAPNGGSAFRFSLPGPAPLKEELARLATPTARLLRNRE